MRLDFKYLLLVLIYALLATTGFSQRGPGGVSVDGNDQKNCRLWLDAGDLTELADGDSVIVWYDKSVSAIRDSAFRDPQQAHKYIYPLYRNAPSASINGKPVVSFEYGGMLGIGKWPNGSPSTDLNSNPGKITTYEQTLFFAFRTSNDVSERQIIWEEGGAERGITIYIYDNHVYIGAFDVNGSDKDYNYQSTQRVAAFGFTYKRLPIQANTTYVLAYKYDVRTDNKLILNNSAPSGHTGLTGTLNGQPFPPEMSKGGGPGVNCSGCHTGVGGIWSHDDPIGIGGINQGSYHEQGRIYGGSHSNPVQNVIKRNTYTGTHLFTGRIAEIVYYAYALNLAEQIIVENYLAAKYFANVISNDKYIYESSYGDGLIGIGREQTNPTPVEHNTSQGDNLFEIRSGGMGSTFNTSPQYVMVGHNNAAISWTKNNTPDTASIQRLRRIWRWDLTGAPVGSSKTIKLRLGPEDIGKLPPLPSGYTKYGVMIGDENQTLPNFTGDYGQVIEFLENAGQYFADVSVKKGTYLTLCAIKPVVQFRLSSDFAIEGNIGTDLKMAEIYLNYKPAPTTAYEVGFEFIDGTALLNDDYLWNPLDTPITFSNMSTSKFIKFEIVNDATVVNDLPVETFSITLTSANNGLNIGAQHTLVYSIYDNDPPPKVSFEYDNADYNEGEGVIQIPVNVIGELTGSATATVEYVSGSGTATLGEDFTLSSPQTLNFTLENSTDYFTVNIIDDLIDEKNEFFTLRITNTTGDLGFDETLNIEMNIHIIDNDLPPTVSFVTPASEGYRSISNPQIFVQLSAPSAKEILVPFIIKEEGTAINDAVSNGGDYSAAPEGGVLVFQPGDSIKILYQDDITDELHLIVYNGLDPQPDGVTIIFELDEEYFENASMGSIPEHIYTIKDYTEYEWKGVAGIGKLPDNTIWMVPDAATSGSDIPNLSPRSIQISQNTSNRTPTLTTHAGGLNNKKLLQFSGSQHLIPASPGFNQQGQSELIQMSGFYDSKSFFFVVIPEVVNQSEPQVIFESGAQRAGMSLYIKENTLYFFTWGYQDNRPQQGVWGLDPNNQLQGVAYTQYDGLVAGEPYIISCHYENTHNITPTIAGLSLFVNGEKVDTYDGEVRRLQGNEGSASIGSVLWQTRFIDTKYFTNNGSHTVPCKNEGCTKYFFEGKMGDFLYYNEPKMNESRARIIHNYLSAKYNIPLNASAQDFDLTYADNTTTTDLDFNYQVAGIGKVGDDLHGDSQGESELRVRNATFNTGIPTAFLMWGNNGESLTNTWPVSSATLPSGIRERSAKVWRFMGNPTDGVQSADFHIRYTTAENASVFSGDQDFLKLLVSESPTDFSNADVYAVSGIESGHIARFSNIPVTEGMYVTLANTSPIYPLPIELLNFDARLNGSAVDISWTTSSEHNNDYFIVERAGTNLKWEELIQIPGAGNSNTLLKYFEKDRKPLSGMAYYRLKQIDYDGAYKYSDVVSVVNNITESGDDIYLFPNPSSGSSVFMRVPYAVARSSSQVSFYNLSGIKVREMETPQDATTFELKYGNLPAGVYFIKIENDFIQEVKKLVIQ